MNYNFIMNIVMNIAICDISGLYNMVLKRKREQKAKKKKRRQKRKKDRKRNLLLSMKKTYTTLRRIWRTFCGTIYHWIITTLVPLTWFPITYSFNKVYKGIRTHHENNEGCFTFSPWNWSGISIVWATRVSYRN